jgi:hypothetical protein
MDIRPSADVLLPKRSVTEYSELLTASMRGRRAVFSEGRSAAKDFFINI